MRTALGAEFEIYDFETEQKTVVQGRPIAWMKALDWLAVHEGDFPQAAQATLGVYMWGLFAIRCAGKADELGISSAELTKQSVYEAMSRIDIKMILDPVGEEPPLAQAPKRK